MWPDLSRALEADPRACSTGEAASLVSSILFYLGTDNCRSSKLFSTHQDQIGLSMGIRAFQGNLLGLHLRLECGPDCIGSVEYGNYTVLKRYIQSANVNSVSTHCAQHRQQFHAPG